jgi:hypothetical protein
VPVRVQTLCRPWRGITNCFDVFIYSARKASARDTLAKHCVARAESEDATDSCPWSFTDKSLGRAITVYIALHLWEGGGLGGGLWALISSFRPIKKGQAFIGFVL